jgi:flagellar biosynthesis protein FliQ
VNEADAVDLMHAAIWTVIAVSGPCVVAAMIIGIIIAALQALTQIQEVTLTFIPKIMTIFVVAMFSAYYMGASLFAFATLAYARIETGF